MNNNPPDNVIAPAQLHWDDDGQPVSSQFGDVYFSRANGLAETRHVFLQHNQLSQRWQTLPAGSFFTIAETGFGSGLNFLAAWQLWLTTAPATAQLHFVSVEKFPLGKADLHRALALWPELEELATQLLDAYPVIVGSGFHRRSFMDGRVKLTLIINDAAAGFKQLLATSHPLFARECARVDAWFLDGFAPAKNPQMWSDDLFHTIALLSHQQTTAATFSAAAIVKQGLKNCGFRIEKVPGFGRKRDMVKAVFEREAETLRADDFINRRSFSPYPAPWTIQANHKIAAEKHVLIIGGGLAGCTSAHALAERGWRVTLVERHAQLAQEASGNPQGILYAKLSHKEEAQAEFNLAALQYALEFYRPYWEKIGAQTGVLQLAHDQAEQQLHTQLHDKFSNAADLVNFLSAAEASAVAGIPLSYSALHFPQAGWIDPRKLCEQLIHHPAIHVVTHTHVLDIDYVNEQWQLRGADIALTAPVIVLANARDAQKIPLAAHLPVKSIRGQISYLPQTSSTAALKTVLCSEGYIGPATAGIHCTGATFNLKDDEIRLRTADHQTNLANVFDIAPLFAQTWRTLNAAELDGRVAFRCTLPDYLPVVGPLPDEEPMLRDFALLRKNSRAGIPIAGSYLPGLYINIGHGSRGLAYTPLCAELLAAQINCEVLPINRGLANALHPARFLMRDLIKNKR